MKWGGDRRRGDTVTIHVPLDPTQATLALRDEAARRDLIARLAALPADKREAAIAEAVRT